MGHALHDAYPFPFSFKSLAPDSERSLNDEFRVDNIKERHMFTDGIKLKNVSSRDEIEPNATLEVHNLLNDFKKAEEDLAKAQNSINACLEKQTALRSQANASKQVAKAAANALAELEQEPKEDLDWLSKAESFSFESIRNSCDGFHSSNLIGEGSSGTVFKGNLQGTPVAIKLFQNSDSISSHNDFLCDAIAHSAMRHPNVVLLLGYCDHLPVLVFEYLSNGSLFSQLSNKQNSASLPWRIRLKLFLDVCRALVYLHSRSLPNLYLDLSSANVLIDHNFNAKLSNVSFCSFVDSKDNANSKALTRGSLGFVHAASHMHSLGTILWDILLGPEHSSKRLDLISDFESMEMKQIFDFDHLTGYLDPTAGNWPRNVLISLLEIARDCCYAKGDENLLNLDSIMESLMEFHDVLEHYAPFYQPNIMQSFIKNLSSRFCYVPEEFICPISKEIMKNPVVATDGYTYDHEAITKWLGTRYVSPKTGLPMFDKHLVPNHALRSMIIEWEEIQKE